MKKNKFIIITMSLLCIYSCDSYNYINKININENQYQKKDLRYYLDLVNESPTDENYLLLSKNIDTLYKNEEQNLNEAFYILKIYFNKNNNIEVFEALLKIKESFLTKQTQESIIHDTNSKYNHIILVKEMLELFRISVKNKFYIKKNEYSFNTISKYDSKTMNMFVEILNKYINSYLSFYKKNYYDNLFYKEYKEVLNDIIFFYNELEYISINYIDITNNIFEIYKKEYPDKIKDFIKFIDLNYPNNVYIKSLAYNELVKYFDDKYDIETSKYFFSENKLFYKTNENLLSSQHEIKYRMNRFYEKLDKEEYIKIIENDILISSNDKYNIRANYEKLISFYKSEKNYEKAIEYTNKLIELFSDSLELYIQLIEMYIELDNEEKILETLKKINNNRKSELCTVYKKIGDYYYLKKKYEKSIKYYNPENCK